MLRHWIDRHLLIVDVSLSLSLSLSLFLSLIIFHLSFLYKYVCVCVCVCVCVTSSVVELDLIVDARTAGGIWARIMTDIWLHISSILMLTQLSR